MSATSHTLARPDAVLDFGSDATWRTRHRLAWQDLSDAVRLWRLSWTLAWLDIKLRYRGSLLGPFWLTMSTAVMVGAMGGIYSTLFHMRLAEYLPFLALSLVLWGFIGSLVGEGCSAFVNAEAMIRAERMPYTIYAARIVLRNLLVLAHNLLVIVAVFALLDTWPGITALLAVPAAVLWLIDGVALALLLGAVCGRFRDIRPIVNSMLQMAFFVTPVIWKPELVGPGKAWLLPFNPIFSLLQVVRLPLLGGVPSPAEYASALLFSLLLCGLSWMFFARARGRVAYWI